MLKNRFIKWGLLIAGACIIFIGSFYLYVAYFLPLPESITNYQDYPTSKIYDRNGILLYEILKPDTGKQTNIELAKIPDYLKNATLAAEDINYYSHPGVDVVSILRAAFFNLKEARVVSGASTITQQLARSMAGMPANRGFADKALEAMYAIRMNNVYSKDKILELYLNRIYYGNLSYGIESAALNYFGRHASDLDLAQSSFLAGLPQSPSKYNPYVDFNIAKKRQKYVLDQMVKHNLVKQEESDAAFDEPLSLGSNKHMIKAPHFVHYIMNKVEDMYGNDALLKRGLDIKTTLDYNLQLKAEDTITRQIDKLKDRNVNNAALVAVDVLSGQVLTWAGSKDYFDKNIDGAVDMATALRQPGSSIKPLTYLLSFEKGYSPATIIYDIATEFATDAGPYSPKNYDLDYHGPVRVRTALASSYNIPAVKTLEYVGVNNFILFLQKLGINTLQESGEHYGLALTLGGGEVRLIDMIQAYDVLANLGNKIDYSTILSITDNKGNELYKWQQPQPVYILGNEGKQHAYQVIDIIKDPNARIPGFGEDNILQLSKEAAVKTGTTRNFRDNWTIGFSPTLLTGVWVGNADGSPMKNISGVDGAAPIWAEFMESALQNTPDLHFQRPDGLQQVELCALSGKLPSENCGEKIFEWLTPQQIPKEKDDYYKSFLINNADGKIIPENCKNDYPRSLISEKVLVAYPAQLQKWASSKGLALPVFEPCSRSSDNTNDYTNGYTGENPAGAIIESPANNDEFIIDYTLPLDAQKIPIRVNVPYETIKVEYFADGEKIGAVDEKPFTYLWQAQKGKHTIYAEAVMNDNKIVKTGSVNIYIN